MHKKTIRVSSEAWDVHKREYVCDGHIEIGFEWVTLNDWVQVFEVILKQQTFFWEPLKEYYREEIVEDLSSESI